MNKPATTIIAVLQGLGIIAAVALVIAIKVGSLQFAIWVMQCAPYWITAPLTAAGACFLIVRGIAWIDRKEPTERTPQ